MTWQSNTAFEVIEQLEKQDFSPQESIDSISSRYQQTESKLKAFLSFDADHAKTQIQSNENPGPLLGLPISIKDNICTLATRTTAGSKFLENFQSPYEATAISRLRKAGAIVLGKTNLDEFGMGGSTENSAYMTSRNPWNTECVPGGSSGGAAASVAAGSSYWALGSDTGGSIRQPSAFCGTTGLKPTYGRVSRYGLIAFASSLDQIGPITRSAKDAALLMSVISGHDPLDSTSSRAPVPDFLGAIENPIAGLRIGVLREHFDGLDPEIINAFTQSIDVFVKLGAQVADVSQRWNEQAVAAYYIIACCEASSNLARYDGVRYTARENETNLGAMYRKSRARFFGDEVKRRILLGTYALSSGYFDQYYMKASKIRRLIKSDFDDKFKEFDLLIGPTTPSTAFKVSESNRSPLELYRGDVFTVSANLAGIPAISIPCGFSSTGLPIGIQIMAADFAEDKILQAAHQFQRNTDWHLRRPQL